MKRMRFGLRLKLGIGFGLVIVIMLILGGVAVWNMFGVQRQSTILDQEYMPEVKTSNNLERFVRQTVDNISRYGLSEEQRYLDAGTANLEAVKQTLQDATALAASAPHLVALKTAIPDIKTEVADYEQLVADTIAKNTQIASARQTLDEAAAQYMQSCYGFLSDTNDSMDTEIIAGFPPERLSQRLTKVTLINDVIDLGNATRIATFKSQALRNPTLIQEALNNFEQIEQKLQQLLTMTRLDENIQYIENIRASAQAYGGAMSTLLENWLALQELETQRQAVADRVLAQTQASMERGVEQTGKISTDTVSSLSAASRILITGVIVAVVLGIGAALIIARGIVGPMTKSVAFAQAVSEGNLMATVDVRQSDEIGMLADALRGMIAKLRSIVSDVKNAADNVAEGSQAMSSSSEEMSNGATEQAAAAEEASSSMEEMAANIRQNADNALQTEKIAVQAAADAKKSGEAVAETVQAMKEIVRQISIIEEIARQTHTLSLNATIEAAKAEQYGKGFAVVASEVRALASRSQTAASEINSMAGSSIAVAEKAGAMLEKLVPDIQKTAELVQEINAASREQNTGTQQINRAIQQLDSVTQQNSATSEELSATAEELASQAEMLQHTIAFFVVGEGDRQQGFAGRGAEQSVHSAEASHKSAHWQAKQHDETSDSHSLSLNGSTRSGDTRDDEFERY